MLEKLFKFYTPINCRQNSNILKTLVKYTAVTGKRRKDTVTIL